MLGHNNWQHVVSNGFSLVINASIPTQWPHMCTKIGFTSGDICGGAGPPRLLLMPGEQYVLCSAGYKLASLKPNGATKL